MLTQRHANRAAGFLQFPLPITTRRSAMPNLSAKRPNQRTPSLRTQLLRLSKRDQATRASLAADPAFEMGYHPRIEEAHRENAARLRDLIECHGWPNESKAGAGGAEAAWLIAQHAIGEPTFMRTCRVMLDEESGCGRVPRWQFAYIDDRIRVFTDLPQRHGTQIDVTPLGAAPHPIEDVERLASLRASVGLPPISQTLARFSDATLPTRESYDAKQSAERAWRRRVGWV
jgi:hypothetical protein